VCVLLAVSKPGMGLVHPAVLSLAGAGTVMSAVGRSPNCARSSTGDMRVLGQRPVWAADLAAWPSGFCMFGSFFSCSIPQCWAAVRHRVRLRTVDSPRRGLFPGCRLRMMVVSGTVRVITRASAHASRSSSAASSAGVVRRPALAPTRNGRLLACGWAAARAGARLRRAGQRRSSSTSSRVQGLRRASNTLRAPSAQHRRRCRRGRTPPSHVVPTGHRPTHVHDRLPDVSHGPGNRRRSRADHPRRRAPSRQATSKRAPPPKRTITDTTGETALLSRQGHHRRMGSDDDLD